MWLNKRSEGTEQFFLTVDQNNFGNKITFANEFLRSIAMKDHVFGKSQKKLTKFQGIFFLNSFSVLS